jgi:hypothetical protein
MSLSTVTTLGYSISGGLQAGPYLLPTLGYGIGDAVEIDETPVYRKTLYCAAGNRIDLYNATGNQHTLYGDM